MTFFLLFSFYGIAMVFSFCGFPFRDLATPVFNVPFKKEVALFAQIPTLIMSKSLDKLVNL